MGRRERRPARTVLEGLIRARRFTLDEFAEYAEQFGREHGERGTLSRRHLDRLVAGRDSHGMPIATPNVATARLLERIFGRPIDELLSYPVAGDEISPDELRARIVTATTVDETIISAFRDRLSGIRVLDREWGARATHDDVRDCLAQATELYRHSFAPGARGELAAIVAEIATLAAWQSLDTGNTGQAWKFYGRARSAADGCADPSFAAHTAAETANVLLELGETGRAVDLLRSLRETTGRRVSPLVRSWLAAAHGDACAAHGDYCASLRAFDYAETQLPADSATGVGPYLPLDPVHLLRWRGHALARAGSPEAVEVLTSALVQHDPTFTRAATALRVDLATAYAAQREFERARRELEEASNSADHLGSRRQLRRIRRLEVRLRSNS